MRAKSPRLIGRWMVAPAPAFSRDARPGKASRGRPDGGVSVSDGLYPDTGEYVGGCQVRELAGLDETLERGRKAASACRALVEVRPFHEGSSRDVHRGEIGGAGAPRTRIASGAAHGGTIPRREFARALVSVLGRPPHLSHPLLPRMDAPQK